MSNNSNGRLPLVEDQAPVTTITSECTSASSSRSYVCSSCRSTGHDEVNCPTRSVVEALEKSHPGQPTPSEIYFYETADGQPVGAVARFEAGVLGDKKAFRQLRSEGGAYGVGLDGLVLPLYRAGEVMTAVAAGRTIFVVEGEKCADALAELGLVATTNSGGAGQWRDHHAEALRGADVVVIPDLDAPGQRHALQVANALHEVAERVRLVQLPSGLGESADVVDYLASGKNVVDLEDLVVATSDWMPSEEDEVGGVRLPAFPMEVFPAVFQDLIACFAGGTASSAELAALPLLAVVSAALGPDWRCGSRSFIRPPSLWFCNVAPSGGGKSPTARPVLEPLYAHDKTLRNDHDQAQRVYEVKLGEWKRRKPKERDPQDQPTPPMRRRAIITDFTVEALCSELGNAEGHGLLIHSDEVAALLDGLDGYGKGGGRRGRAIWLSLWNGDKVRTVRKTVAGAEVDRPHFAVLGGIQPSVLNTMRLSDGDGLTSRFLWSHAACRPRGLGDPIDPRITELWRRIVGLALEHQVRDPQHFTAEGERFLDECLLEWNTAALELDNAGSGLLSSFYGKAGEYLVRLTGLLHAMDAIALSLAIDPLDPPPLAPRPLALDCVQRAEKLVDYFLAHGAYTARKVTTQDRRTVVRGEGHDLELAAALALVVQPGRDATHSPGGWEEQVGKHGVRLNAREMGHALKRLSRSPVNELLVRPGPRSKSRCWTVSHPARGA